MATKVLQHMPNKARQPCHRPCRAKAQASLRFKASTGHPGWLGAAKEGEKKPKTKFKVFGKGTPFQRTYFTQNKRHAVS